MHILKNKFLLLVPAMLLVCWGIYSCKKSDESTSITAFLTGGTWQLASLQVQNIVGTTSTTDTLNTNCKYTQKFNLKTDGTCQYDYYSCLNNQATGGWSFDKDSLLLKSDMVCKDTTAAGSLRPFKRAQVYSLGQNTMVLLIDDTLSVSSTTGIVTHKITRYGFIH